MGFCKGALVGRCGDVVKPAVSQTDAHHDGSRNNSEDQNHQQHLLHFAQLIARGRACRARIGLKRVTPPGIEPESAV